MTTVVCFMLETWKTTFSHITHIYGHFWRESSPTNPDEALTGVAAGARKPH